MKTNPNNQHDWIGKMIWMRVLLGWWHIIDRQMKIIKTKGNNKLLNE
jgi:hypothetical protein